MTHRTPAERRPFQPERLPNETSASIRDERHNRWREFLGKDLLGRSAAVITDCVDDNAKGRVETRLSSILEGQVTTVRIESADQLDAASNQLQAAGNLIDQLDALEDRPGIIAVNVAPRHKDKKAISEGDNGNGTHFGYFRYKNAVVVSSIDGYTLSLVKKLGLTDTIHQLEIEETFEILHERGLIDSAEIEKTSNTQFRSFNFLPKIGAYILKEGDIQSTPIPIAQIPDAPDAVWCVEGFGNLKTTLLPEEYGISSRITPEEIFLQEKLGKGKLPPLAHIETKWGALPLYRRLTDAHEGATVLTVGSSGIGTGAEEKRFIELPIKGQSAAKTLNVSVGSAVL